MSNKHQHLQFLQDAIARMSNHSFVLKGWMITIVAGLVALSFTAHQPRLALLSWAAIVFIWFLDAYYLWRERQFRSLYNTVRLKDESDVDFQMNPDLAKEQAPCYLDTLRAATLWPFYLGAALFPVLIFFGTNHG